MGTTELQPGELLMGKYHVEKRLGEGAMGVVYAVVHVELGQRFAVKVMKKSAAQGEQKARFLREARASVKLKTEHVARVVDVGATNDGSLYIVMEHLEGRDLLEEIRRRGQLPFEEAVEYVLQACEAVAEAHAAGIVHRDIKPANLFLTTGTGGIPRVKVLDFGISKVADEVGLTGDLVLGSPLYMAPEHMSHSAEVDGRADIWALGVTLYELVAGKTPFHADRIEIVCALVFEQAPAPLAKYRQDAPPGFEAVIRMCLEKDRTRRLPSAAALAAALVPYGPKRAALYAERAALALGEPVVMSRPTVELPASAPSTLADSTAGPSVTMGASRSGLQPPLPVPLSAGSVPAASSPAMSMSPLVSQGDPATKQRGARLALMVVLGGIVVGSLVGLVVSNVIYRDPPTLPASGSAAPPNTATPLPVVSPALGDTTTSAPPLSAAPPTSASAPAGAASTPTTTTVPGHRKSPSPATTAPKAKRNIYDQ